MADIDVETCDCVFCGGGVKKEDKQLIDAMSRIWRSHPWAFHLGPMSEPERKFYDPEAKRER